MFQLLISLTTQMFYLTPTLKLHSYNFRCPVDGMYVVNVYKYKYIYIYICVCVCACVRVISINVYKCDLLKYINIPVKVLAKITFTKML